MLAHMNKDEYDQEITLLSRSELVNNLFGDVGKLLDCDFNCAIESKTLIHGKLYISDRAICFYAKLNAIDRKIKIPFDCIKRFDKASTALVIPNSILVETDLHAYYFRSFLDRNNCFDILSSQIKEYRSSTSKYSLEMKMQPVGFAGEEGPSTGSSSRRSSSEGKTDTDWDYGEEGEEREEEMMGQGLAAEAKASYK